MTTQPSASPICPIDTAVQHHHAGRLTEAEALYRRILADDPHHLDALHLLGVVHIQKGRLEEAVEFISQSLAGNPDNYNPTLPLFFSTSGMLIRFFAGTTKRSRCTARRLR